MDGTVVSSEGHSEGLVDARQLIVHEPCGSRPDMATHAFNAGMSRILIRGYCGVITWHTLPQNCCESTYFTLVYVPAETIATLVAVNRPNSPKNRIAAGPVTSTLAIFRRPPLRLEQRHTPAGTRISPNTKNAGNTRKTTIP